MKQPRVAVDRYVVDTLMRDLVGHDRSPSAFVVYLHLWAAGAGNRGRHVKTSHQEIAGQVGLSKTAVQIAIKRLVRRRLLHAERSAPTAVPDYFVMTPWRSRPTA